MSFRHDPEQVLRVDVVDLKAVNSVARMVSKWGSPGEYRCYNVDFSREFRYCLEEGIDPLPNSRTLADADCCLGDGTRE